MPLPDVALLVGLNFRGNHCVLHDRWCVLRSRSGSGKRGRSRAGTDVHTWPTKAIIERGYSLATFFNGDAVPDDPETAGARLADFTPPNTAVSASDAPATIACWAWSLSRALDYLTSDSAIAQHRVAVVGHSRNGKTALLAGALDRRSPW